MVHNKSCALLALLALTFSTGASAHEFSITPATVVITGDGGFQVDIALDADALALGLPLETDSEQVAQGMRELAPEGFSGALESARRSIRQDLRISFDAAPAEFEVTFPHYGTPAATEAEIPTVLGALARLRGQIPAGAGTLTFQAAERYKTVSLEFVSPARETPYALLLEPGEASSEISLAEGEDGAQPQGVFTSYLRLGFTHIVPKGLDHILFVVGLFLLSTRWRPLLYQVTAFTIAHSVTLGLSMQGVVSLPERFVETLIALSISWVAIENIATSELKPWRIVIVFCFGLLHGLGFAGVLSELGMPEGRFLTALLSFNLGVELGQLGVVVLAFAITGRFRRLAGYRRYVVIPCSAAIAAVGCWWSVTRALL